MTDIILDFLSNPGGRTLNEDRAKVVYLDDKKLHVAIVADGVGGEDVGYVAAQTAIDSFLEHLGNSKETNIPDLLKESVRFANQAVVEVMKNRGGATTLAVAAIHDSKMLYVANVGDSRIYLCRNNDNRYELTQLTVDHTFANVMPWRGEMSVEAARENPQADDLVYVLGRKPQVPVDIGFYGNNSTDPKSAQTRGKNGLSLKSGDSILVCSDGLIKNSPQTGQPFTKTEEIVEVLTTQEGKRAAGSLVAFALGREATDNVSVAMLQMPDPERHKRAQRPLRIAGWIIAGLVVLIAAIIYLASNRINIVAQEAILTQTAEAIAAAQQAQQFDSLAATSTREAFERGFRETAVAATQTAQPTVTPTATSLPRNALPPDKIGEQFSLTSNVPIPIAENDNITVGNFPVYLRIRQDEEARNDADIYVRSGSRLQLIAVSGDRMWLRMFASSNVFIRTGGYVGGITVAIPEAPSLLEFSVAGSCMSIDYPLDSNQMLVNCFAGVCSYSIGGETPVDINVGNQLVFDRQSLVPVSAKRIPESEAVLYQQELAQFGIANVSCLASYIPTPVPTPTRIIIVPTHTPTAPGPFIPPTDAPTVPPPTDAPTVPPPTDAPTVPPPTNTPTVPPPTNTPTVPPPTNTPTVPPPTDTPTNTPVPPRPTETSTPGITVISPP